jgi:hypothetical protein
MLFGDLGGGHGPAAFVGAADHALLVAVAFLIAARGAVFWLPKHARAAHQVAAPHGGGAGALVAGSGAPMLRDAVASENGGGEGVTWVGSRDRRSKPA